MNAQTSALKMLNMTAWIEQLTKHYKHRNKQNKSQKEQRLC